MSRNKKNHKNQKKKPKNRLKPKKIGQPSESRSHKVKHSASFNDYTYSSISSTDIKDILNITTPLWTVVDHGIPNSDI